MTKHSIGARALAVVLAFFGITACSSGYTPGDELPAKDDVDGGSGGKKPAQSQDGTQPPPAAACSDDCADDERRCKVDSPGSFEVCVRGANGCLSWVTASCAGGAACDPANTKACFGQCPPAGKESCNQLDSKRCTSNKLETCTLDAGCAVWKATEDCAATGKICDGTSCVTQCTSNCTTANEKRCVSGTNNYETCTQVQPGCLRWQGATSCGSGKVCQGAGSCVNACTSNCTTLGQQRCSGVFIQQCNAAADGCRYWTNLTQCASRCAPTAAGVPKCGCFADNCNGCCSAQSTTGVCLTGLSLNSCGKGGAVCQDCAGRSCAGGRFPDCSVSGTTIGTCICSNI